MLIARHSVLQKL